MATTKKGIQVCVPEKRGDAMAAKVGGKKDSKYNFKTMSKKRG